MAFKDSVGSLDRIANALENMSGGGGGGGGSGILVVHCDNDTRALDKTWSELSQADFAVLPLVEGNGEEMRKRIFILNELLTSPEVSFSVVFCSYDTVYTFVAETPDGYPVYTEYSPIPAGGLDPGDGGPDIVV